MFTLPVRDFKNLQSKPIKKSNVKKRTKKDYALMIKVVRKCFEQLSSSDKYIYEILTEYDFEDSLTGYCKGYIFPSLATVAADYKLKLRTLYRHILRLEKLLLIKRIRRQNKSSIIQILDIPEDLLSTYRNERKSPKVANVYSSKLLNNRRIIASVANVNFLFTAREYACYERLVSWGYHPNQAIRDITNSEIGVQKIEERLADLHTLLQANWTPRQKVAQWLNWALRSDDILAMPTKNSSLLNKRSTEEISKYEEYTDEQGYTNFRPKTANSNSTEEQTNFPFETNKHLTLYQQSDSRNIQLDGYTGMNVYPHLAKIVSAYVPPSHRLYAAYLPPVLGGRYDYSGDHNLPHYRNRPGFSPSRVVATRPLSHHVVKTDDISFCESGRVDQTRAGVCVSLVIKNKMSKEKNEEKVVKVFKYIIFFGGGREEGRVRVRRIESVKESKRKAKQMVRKPRADKGVTPLTPRDLAVLHWIGEMYVARVDQVRALLQLNTENPDGEQPTLSTDAARKVVERWVKRGVARYEKILANHGAYVWLTPRGLREMGFKEPEFTYRDWSPRPTTIEHYYWVNHVRMYLENKYADAISWTCERTIKMQRVEVRGHYADGEVERGKYRFAIEVEISKKKRVEVEDIIGQLLANKHYDATWYFVNDATKNLINEVRNSLEDSQKKRLSIVELKTITAD